jgi:hypothetical protein
MLVGAPALPLLLSATRWNSASRLSRAGNGRGAVSARSQASAEASDWCEYAATTAAPFHARPDHGMRTHAAE